MKRDDKIFKLINEKLDALEELRKIKNVLTSKVAKTRINIDILEICAELDKLYELTFYW